MRVLRELKHQMRVVSNPAHREAIGGFRLLFVGTGARLMKQVGWWQTRLNYYALDSSDLRLPVRLPERKASFTRQENDVILYAPNTTYEEHYEAPCEFADAWIVFQRVGGRDPLAPLVRGRGYRAFQDTGLVIRRLIEQCADIASPEAGARWLAQSAFLRIMSHLVRSSEGDGVRRLIQPLAETPSPDETPFRRRVMKAVRQHLAEDISVEQLAQILKVSRSTLSHRFSAEIGETLTTLKNRLRLEKAQELIRDTDRTFKEIAFEVGYEDPAYFSRLFQAKTGLTPKAFRHLVCGMSVPEK